MTIRPPSFADVLRAPRVRALMMAAALSRLSGQMFALTLILHALSAFGSPWLAGWIAFAAVAPGLAISPLAGAVMDRAGAARGIAIDLAAGTAVALTLAVMRGGPVMTLVLAGAYSLTGPLGAAGIRTLLPRMVPAGSLDRANALDTALNAAADIGGPALAGLIAGSFGTPAAFTVIAACQALAAAALLRLPVAIPAAHGRFWAQALEGIGFVARRKFLRGLAIGYALNQVTWGILTVSVPVALGRIMGPDAWQQTSGLIWSAAGVAGMAGALLAGQVRVHGREVMAMTMCMALSALAIWPLAGWSGLTGIAATLTMAGFLAGPIDVALLTFRQRRTDPTQLGRVLAVSMSVNMAGFPIGTALGGALVAHSMTWAFSAAAVASVLAAIATYVLIPASDRT